MLRWLDTEKKGIFPIRVWTRSELNLEVDFGVVRHPLPSGELLVNKPLNGRRGLSPLGCLRAIRLAWARFKWRIVGR